MVNRVVPDEDLLSEALAACGKAFRRLKREAMRATKQLFHEVADLPLEEALKRGREVKQAHACVPRSRRAGMGVAFALAAMLCFAANILITRYAVARHAGGSGFLRRAGDQHPVSGDPVPVRAGGAHRALGLGLEGRGRCSRSAASIGTFLGRRLLFDAVRLLGPSRASVFHSTAPAFALIGAWLLADERLGLYEIGLMAVVWLGLWFTQPRAGSGSGSEPALRRRTCARECLRACSRSRASASATCCAASPCAAGTRRSSAR